VLESRPPAVERESGLVSPHVLWEVCGGDAAALKKICDAFLARVPDHLAAVQDALSTQDSARMRQAAHKLSGTLAAFSEVAGGVASDLEDLAAQGRLGEAAPMVEQLETMARELIRLAGSLSLETLRKLAEIAEDGNQTRS
jgi:two-component system, sensor histidine kinase and response regulator